MRAHASRISCLDSENRFGGPVESGDKILRHFRENGQLFPLFESAIERYKNEYLRSYNVRGDGHCLFYAVIRCIVSAYARLSDATKNEGSSVYLR